MLAKNVSPSHVSQNDMYFSLSEDEVEKSDSISGVISPDVKDLQNSNCSKDSLSDEGNVGTEVPEVHSFDEQAYIQSLRSGSAYRINCQIGDATIESVVDSGADVTMLSEEVAAKLSFRPEIVSSITIHTAGEGKSFSAKKVGPIKLKLGDFSFSTFIYIGPIGDSMLVGIDILNFLGAVIDLQNKTLKWKGGHSLPLFTDTGKAKESQEEKKQSVSCTAESSEESKRCDRGKDTISEVYLCRRIKVPANSQVIARLFVDPSEHKSEFLLFEPDPSLKACVANSIHKKSKSLSLSFVNPGIEPVTIKKKTFLGFLHSLDRSEVSADQPIQCESCASDSSPRVTVRVAKKGEDELPERLQSMFKEGCSNLTSEADKASLKSLLVEFQDVFATSDTDLGNFTTIEHRIDIGDAKPVALPLRRCPIHFVDEEKKELEKMLSCGVIKPSQSEWAAAPVLVRKRDDKIRWCLDFRRLNALTKKDTFPLPNMTECIDSLDGNQWFSKLDANSAYWQIGLHEDDREKTAFRTKYGLFEFNRMAFGLVNAPSTFSRAMALILAGLTWSVVLAYLDDVCVLGRSTKEHLDNLRTVFERFRQHGMKLKGRKCQLFQKKMEFLGRLVSSDGTTLTDHSIEAIKSWVAPDSTRSLQRLLGMANFHREYIKDFAGVTESLYQVVRSKKFFWGSAQQKAFENLKKLLISPAVLAIPSAGKQFFLATDSSDYASGAVLSQLQNGVERVIAYGSFSLTRSQRRYCTTKKELLAIVRFCHHWRHYLLGVDVICRTDHRALAWLTNFKDIQGQLARWLEELSRYNLVIQYVPGKDLAHADALSRLNTDPCPIQVAVSDLPCGGCPACLRLDEKWRAFREKVDNVVELSAPTVKQVQVKVPDTTTVGDNDLVVTGMTVYVRQVQAPSDLESEAALGPTEFVIEEQLKDPNLEFILSWLKDGSVPDAGILKLACAEKRFFWTHREFFFLNDGVLFRKGEDLKDLVVVPVSLREEVLKLCHDVASAAHQGKCRTRERISQSFFWYGMSSDIKEYVRGCSVCNKNKPAHRKNKFPLTQNHAGLPLEKVHIDFIGPLPESASGNQHILVIVDQFTKWLEVIPLPSQKAEVTAQALVDHFFARFGSAAQIVTDQGTNFESTLFKQVCKLLGIHKSRTTAWRPSANGQVERHNLTIKNAIRCYVSEHQEDWDVNLPLIASAIRASVNRSTGFTPNRLMLGREISIPTDIIYPDKKEQQLHDDFVAQLQKGLHNAHESARKTLQVRLKKSKKFYDIGVKKVEFRPGDVVYYLDKMRKNKLSHVWIGPCLVIYRSSPYNFDILIDNRIEKRVNHDLLKPCTDRLVPKWIKVRQDVIKKELKVTYCICRRPDDGRVMVQCDKCKDWFHHHCLGLSQSRARRLGSFLCPVCK